MSVIFITGANRGIGLSLTQQYLKGNHKVYATYRDASSATELLSLAGHSSNLTCIQLEITDYQAVSQLPSQVDQFSTNVLKSYNHKTFLLWRLIVN